MAVQKRAAIIIDAEDGISAQRPVHWAIDELRQSLVRQGVAVELRDRIDERDATSSRIAVASASSPAARGMLSKGKLTVPRTPEALALVPLSVRGQSALLACGADVRGLVYALLELKDRVDHADDPLAALDLAAPVVERPANAIRSVMRLFASDVEDKLWFYDRRFWREYLSMLVAQRFNRFNLALGIGYDFPRGIADAYFYFAYPFFLSVPGYDVRVRGLPGAERDRNLEMLEFISGEAAARGLHFQLGLWTHSYELIDSPGVNYTIEGLTAEAHAPYCRDALRLLLQACPAIAGVTMRVHGESGIREGSYDFWKTVFDGVAQCGRPVEIDMHAKGIDQTMIDIALATGSRVIVSPKFWAEHMGLPYQQASVRELERVPEERDGYMAFSAGSRKFTRYGYADLLREDRRYGVLFRMWPGTQRLLLWGDAAMAAGFGRAAGFCGCQGVEFFEPLSFKGRKGSGLPGSRDGYADLSFRSTYDWQKYLYTYRLWGRLTYDPDADPETWRRFLRKQYGTDAPSVEGALSNASRLLPLVTTAHHPSAANNSYWPEMYTNMPIVDEDRPHPYYDTVTPKRFGTVSPLDPVLFAGVDEFAEELATGERSGKASPYDVASWLDGLADAAAAHLAQMQGQARSPDSHGLRRVAVDVAILIGLGRFFARKLRAGVLYGLHERTHSRTALEDALKAYRGARDAWEELARRADVYVDDLTFGAVANLRGHWKDRRAAIDLDIGDMEAALREADPTAREGTPPYPAAACQPMARPHCEHVPGSSFRPGQPIAIDLRFPGDDPSGRPTAVRLHYRHVNQAEAYLSADMEAHAGRFVAKIPGDYTDSPYALQYFFELRRARTQVCLYPGLDLDTFSQPYFLIHQRRPG